MFPNLGSSLQQATVIVGFFLPLLLAIPIQTHWSSLMKTLFSVAAYAGAGAIIAAASGSFTGKKFWQVTLETLVLGVIGYQGVWQPSGLAPKIEVSTSTRVPTGQSLEPSSPAPYVAPAGSLTATKPEEATASALQPQLAELIGAAVRLIDNTTARLASTTPEKPST